MASAMGLHHRLLRSLLAVLATLGGVLAAGASPAAAAPAPDPAIAETTFLRLANTARVGAGLAPMTRDPGLDAVARSWAAVLAGEGRLRHRPDLAAVAGAVEPRWRNAGENVGVGGLAVGLHEAFMNSPGHRANVLSPIYNRVGVGVVVDDAGLIWVAVNFLAGPARAGTTGLEAVDPASRVGAADGRGWWLTTAAGEVVAEGSARSFGSMAGRPLARPVVGMAPTPSGSGYWLVAADGGIFAFGDAGFHGSTGGMPLRQPVVGMAPTPSGRGYWLVAADGGIFAFGDAGFHGSTGGMPLNAPVTGMVATASGRGYWLVAADGGIFAFGDARFLGSTGGQRLDAAVSGLAVPPTATGYWLVGVDGSVRAFGTAPVLGAPLAPGTRFTRIAPMADGQGYRIAADDGRVWSFGSAGSDVTPPLRLVAPVVAMANRP
jgi:hypothetical protein